MRSYFPSSAALSALLLLASLPSLTYALTMTYCSSQNTGSDYSAAYSIYQSDGLCTGTCSEYAFAVIQGKDCWCSNYAPSETTSTSDCDSDCPGYPSDKCGSTTDDLYSYFQLSDPSGTVGASSTTAAQATTKKATTVSTTEQATSTTEAAQATSNGATTFQTTTAADSTATDTTATTAPILSTVTIKGSVMTVTAGSSSTGSPDASVVGKSSNHAGAIAGGVVGGLAIVAIVALIIFFVRRKQKKEEADSVADPDANRPFTSISGYSDKDEAVVGAAAAGTAGTRHSRNSSNRLSVADHRTRFGNLYHHQNVSAGNVSLQDNEDYSRQLRVMNPSD